MLLPERGVFAGADMVAGIYIPKLKNQFTYRVFAEISTVSYSMYRNIVPVRGLGTINPKGFSRGPRTIAGSLVFTVFDRHVLYEAQQALAEYYMQQIKQFNNSKYDNVVSSSKTIKFVTDEIPPFDIIVSMANGENPVGSCIRIYGARIMSEGQVMSIEDLITENTMQYMAIGIDLMEPSFDEIGGDPRSQLDYKDSNYTLDPNTIQHNQDGDSLATSRPGIIRVVPAGPMSYGSWAAQSNSPWIHIDSGFVGNGAGTISYHVDPLPAEVTNRDGKISVGSASVSINQRFYT